MDRWYIKKTKLFKKEQNGIWNYQYTQFINPFTLDRTPQRCHNIYHITSEARFSLIFLFWIIRIISSKVLGFIWSTFAKEKHKEKTQKNVHTWSIQSRCFWARRKAPAQIRRNVLILIAGVVYIIAGSVLGWTGKFYLSISKRCSSRS